MEIWEIALIAVGCLIGLYILYRLSGYISRCCTWSWKTCCKPPIDCVYLGCMTPIGHCCRDSIFVCKEGICDCTDACDRCLHPYKRI